MKGELKDVDLRFIISYSIIANLMKGELKATESIYGAGAITNTNLMKGELKVSTRRRLRPPACPRESHEGRIER